MSDMGYRLPSISTIGTLSEEAKGEVLNNLFEPHDSIVRYLKPLFEQSYKDYDQFIDGALKRFQELDPHSELAKDIISSHPRLGVPRGTELSEHSAKEQENLQGDDGVVVEFSRLNKLYESTYPGLRFVLFVNGRDKESVKSVFKQRIERNSYELEVRDAIEAMCDIAKDRAHKLLSKL